MGETAAPTKRPIGERRLAAIVFTDVVGFSARVQENESLTLRLVKRDFAMMTAACVAAGGQVIKNTGDGLLMSFPTASAAVGCALKVQKHLVESAKNLPPDQVLQHRIGIHLGDVLITDGDAMGNDVNIAARVLAEAGGGEICVSQTVYDVVKHRLSIKGVYLGERELKNISEPVPIFKLPVTAVETPERKPMRKRLTMLLAAVAVIAVGIALVVALTSKSKPKEQEQPPALSAATTKPSAEFVDVIRTGGGIWKGRFGKSAAVVFADDPTLVPEHPFTVPLADAAIPAELTLSQCLIERGARLVARAPEPALQAVHTEERIVGGLLTRDRMILRLRLPDVTPRRLTLSFWDFKDAGRVQTITIRDPKTSEALSTKTISGFREGHYVVFAVSGDLLIDIKLDKGPNALLGGLFLDPMQISPTTQADETSVRPTRRGAGPGRRR